MNRKYVVIFLALLCFTAALLALFVDKDTAIAVLNPKGWVGGKERDLMVVATYLMLLVVIPVFIFTFFFVWRYREGNKKAKYTPEWGDSLLAEAIWWGVPCIIILVLSIMTWKGCFELDPFKPLKSEKKPLIVQVVALQWRWLFIYPEQQIASLNHLQIPEKTPIRFEITADAPMNAFWIPELGGQIFAMPGMGTELHLIADEPGSYRGLSANLSGTGFAKMYFMTKATSEEEFHQWVDSVKRSPLHLTLNSYEEMAKPSEQHAPAAYVLDTPDLYETIMMKYMRPMPEMQGMMSQSQEEMASQELIGE